MHGSLVDEYLSSGAIRLKEGSMESVAYLEVAKRILYCRKCGFNVRHPYPGSGTLESKVMVVGESPSPHRRSFENFSERSREVVDAALFALGLSRETVYMTNAVKCPLYPLDLEDRLKYVDPCLEHLLREIEIVRPKIVISLGIVAERAVSKAMRVSPHKFFHLALPHPMKVVYGQMTLEDYIKEAKRRWGLIRYLI
jgi:DNA polymerase